MLRIPLSFVIAVTSVTFSSAFALADQNLQMKKKLAAADAKLNHLETKVHEAEELQALDPDYK